MVVTGPINTTRRSRARSTQRRRARITRKRVKGNSLVTRRKERPMGRKTGKGSNERGESRRREGPSVSRRTIKRDEDSSQLLERGEGPSTEEAVDSSVDSPSETTSVGGPGTDASDRFGGSGRLSESREPPNPRTRGTGGEGGYSTL